LVASSRETVAASASFAILNSPSVKGLSDIPVLARVTHASTGIASSLQNK
jgi:hypothetical protein